MRRAAFLDRDGTLIHDPGYLGDPSGVVLLDGVAEAIALLRSAGFLIVVITNQSGVARGMYDESALHAVNQRMRALLLEQNPYAAIDAIYYCLHKDADACDCRKPRPGMFEQAARELLLDLPSSLAIGDAPRDCAAAKEAGVGRSSQIGAPPLPPSLLAATRLLLGQVPVKSPT